MKKINIIDQIIDSGLVANGSTIIVGFSGGPDSLCLLHALTQIAEPYELTLVPVHINHKIRPSADAEAENAARICDRFDLECLIFEADCLGMAEDLGISTEEAGRKIRYEIFDEVARQLEEDGCPNENIYIALAHNADDQSETVLFRLIRGTGNHGLAGMPYLRPSDWGYMIIRPLLDVPREDIEAYIKANKLHPNIDESNMTSDYARNKIRNELIPYLEKNYNPNIRQALRRFAQCAEADDVFISDITFNEMDRYMTIDDESGTVELDITEMSDYPIAVSMRMFSMLFKMMGFEDRTSFELLQSVLRLAISGNPSSVLDLPDGYKAIKDYDRIIFSDDDEVIDSYLKTIEPGPAYSVDSQIMKIGEFNQMKQGLNEDTDVYAAFDFDRFNEQYPGKAGDITIRCRQEGDFITIRDGAHKKIQDFMVDSKIRKNFRDSIPMVCIESEVLWILPNGELSGEEQKKKGKYSQNFQINEATERVLFLEVEEILW